MSTRGGHILIVDDEEPIRRSIRVFFEDSGFRVLEAGDGSDGLARFRQEKPDLVLVDLRMPGISGLEVIGTLHREAPTVPVVVLSGTGIIADAIEAIRAGAWDYVTKPILDLAQLEHVVTMNLERARLREDRRRYQEHLEEEVTRRTRDLHALNTRLKKMVRSARSIAVCTSIDELARRFLEVLAVKLGADGGSFPLVEHGRLTPVYSVGPNHAGETMTIPPPPHSAWGEILGQHSAVLLPDIRSLEFMASNDRLGDSQGSLPLDVVMPKLSGRDVYDWARQIRPDMATVFCSGYAEGEIHKAFVLEKGLELLRKPRQVQSPSQNHPTGAGQRSPAAREAEARPDRECPVISRLWHEPCFPQGTDFTMEPPCFGNDERAAWTFRLIADSRDYPSRSC